MIVYTLRNKRQVSRRILTLLFIPFLTTVLGYAVNHFVEANGFEVMPVAYVLAQIVYLSIVRRMALYDVSETVTESIVQSGDTGFISFDRHFHYLGSNEKAREVLPALNSLTVDRSVLGTKDLEDNVIRWIKEFDDGNGSGTAFYTCTADGGDEHIYAVETNYLYDGSRKKGYQLLLRDDTENQKYINLIDRYNSELQAEVDAKTQRLVAMHDSFILGMATMVESRDNTTGGHIRRTSVGVRILIEEMKKDNAPLDADFCRNLIKAAPMHDLGKIAVDDAVLRKPGKYTAAEFSEMKKHAAEGARIVREVLKDTDDGDFRRIAENVAHYHHERYDGSGYPDGLKGDAIPLEARIMAIADVYDALVSKRPYKDNFSAEQADRIILEGMGTQFDPALRRYYEAARPALEAFYRAE